jgi:DNA-binding response OmpR family regulator
MKILVIEDEHKIANSIKRGLEQENYIVDVAYDGEEGYDLAASEPYDLIVLDLMLPKMDGITLCKKLRSQDIHTPIIMLTAKGQLADKIEGLNSGADDYLVKPFAFVELVARVRALNRRPPKTQKTILEVGDLTLDPVTFEVKRGTKLIKLSKKEFILLEYLLRHSGKIISKDQIVSGVWSYESEILPNTVEVYIGYLRRKIGEDLIKTVRGFGYKISKN